MKKRFIILPVVAILALTGCMGPYVDEFKNSCDAAGGELLETTKTKSVTGVGIGTDGSPVVTSGTVTYKLRLCLADDGSVIDAVLE